MLRKIEAGDYLIPALHVSSLREGIECFEELNGVVRQFKIGQRAISRGFGHDLANYIQHSGGKVFWDAKWSDVPAEVAESMKGLNETLEDDVWMVSVHANSGLESIRAVAENRGSTQVFVVTVLTSVDDKISEEIYSKDVIEEVLSLVEMAIHPDIQGLICSSREVLVVKKLVEQLGCDLSVLTPAIHSGQGNTRGQKRFSSAREAILNGSDYLVVGSEIMNSTDRIAATYRILEEIDKAVRDANG